MTTETKTTPTEELVNDAPHTQHLVHTLCFSIAVLTGAEQVTAYCGHVIHKRPGADPATLKCPICIDLIGTEVVCQNCGKTVLVQG